MKKDVVISIRGISEIDNERDDIEMTTLGNFQYRNGKYYLSYRESDMTGMEGTVTTLEVDGQRQVIMNRRGTSRSQLIIENGKRHICQYGLEYGGVTLGVSSQKIRNDLSINGGRLTFKYTLDINSELASTNEVHIKVEECKK